MSLTTVDSAHLAASLSTLCVAAFGGGRLFAAARQPQVIGELLGGLLLGPTVLGWITPGGERWLFPASGVDAHALSALYQLGMLFLMFVTGVELRLSNSRGGRTIAVVTVVGLAVPLAVGLPAGWLAYTGQMSGPNGTRATFVLVFGMAVAVTSIPVISRIMLDLGILRTGFARIVLSVAVAEDIVLYSVLAVVLSIARQRPGDQFGLWTLAHDDSPTLSSLYYLGASLVFFGLFLPAGTRLFALIVRTGSAPDRRRVATAAGVILLLVGVTLCSLLGINQVFGALAAGVCVAGDGSRAFADASGESGGPAGDGGGAQERWAALREVSLAFFIPVYFALVGLGLDLRHDFAPWFFAWFLPFACAVKALSVWAGARLAGRPGAEAVDLAVALNARGGPGILLASVALGAGVISQSFATSLVLLSVITSQLAGSWLGRRRIGLSAPSAAETLGQPALAERP